MLKGIRKSQGTHRCHAICGKKKYTSRWSACRFAEKKELPPGGTWVMASWPVLILISKRSSTASCGMGGARDRDGKAGCSFQTAGATDGRAPPASTATTGQTGRGGVITAGWWNPAHTGCMGPNAPETAGCLTLLIATCQANGRLQERRHAHAGWRRLFIMSEGDKGRQAGWFKYSEAGLGGQGDEAVSALRTLSSGERISG